MIYDHIVIRYGEISTKGRNRKGFIDKLKRNIKRALRNFERVHVEADRDRMYVLLNGEDHKAVASILKGIFGIQNFSPAMKAERDIEAVKDAALLYVSDLNGIATFKINTRRSDKDYPYSTDEMNHILGGHILQNMDGIKVDVKNPDLTLRVEIRKEAIFLSGEIIPGAGGLPIGNSGKAMLMLSGGIDSPVAGYLSMKRGLDLECVHFHSPPFTSERSKQKVLDLCSKLAEVSGRITLHIVPFTEIQKLIQKQIPENYTMTSTRRLMLRVADRIRENQNALAIVTGESLGQVASQTLESMYAINEATNTPVLRPLITMDKLDIMKIAEDIDTLEISNRPYEDCCTVFTPANPKTKPKREKVNYYESFVNFDELVEEAVYGIETVTIYPGQTEIDQEDSLDLF
ncbi:tRNA uracil 4-sulfurtransferase ThiI [Peribacillus deserti]|uniref:Probable tRNA sulfurtransferase n=1 Tax=Peribacillus deserti TaxID=673318 RepID=A0A2N5MAX9_9BACI|nr:tRNA uracil 4-sulfurtransferase ThiI [Peribacillus deserti]PLT31503.1 tRNA 4-thiouridine(8) synthase ThiI [Peribacillus deserti]